MISLFTVYSNAQTGDAVNDTSVMGANYINDVFYSLKNGNKTSVDRTNWDIAFRTNIMSSSILTNGGAEVKLYTYPKSDTNGWINTDTLGLYNWKPMFNSLKDWEKGAFMANAGSHPDYGWGKYNSTTHKLHGDSIFIIKLTNSTWKKIWIVQKDSPKNKYYFRIANIDGSNDTTVVINCNDYKTKEFIGYSLVDMKIVDREPELSNWDLLFTKYMDKVLMGPQPVDYPVVGILTANKIQVARVKGYEETTYEDYSSQTFDITSISVIGRDWKSTKGQPPVYSMVDSLLYFIKTADSNIYKLYFVDFESGTAGLGKTMFVKKLLSNSSVSENLKPVFGLSIHPNPANSITNIVFDAKNTNLFNMNIIDAIGKTVYSEKFIADGGLNVRQIDLSGLNSGIYILYLSDGQILQSQKLLIKK